MNFPDFKRLIRPITNKIFLLLGRAVLMAINNSEDTQKIQVIALADETISDIERFQEYGFETYPIPGAEAFIGFLNGNRDHGIILCVHDGRYRPKDLSEGESVVYTDEDQNPGGHRIWLRRGQIIEINCKDAVVNCTGKATINAVAGVDIDGGSGNLSGAVCGLSMCHLTGSFHMDVSPDVKVSKT